MGEEWKEGKKSGRSKRISKEEREGASIPSPVLLPWSVQMSASAHFYESVTANGLKREKEADGTPRPPTDKALKE